MNRELSEKSRLVALLLCWTLGVFGVHRYYVGKVATGLLMLITAGGFGIWWTIDLVTIIVGLFRDKNGQQIYYWFDRGSIR